MSKITKNGSKKLIERMCKNKPKTRQKLDKHKQK